MESGSETDGASEHHALHSANGNHEEGLSSKFKKARHKRRPTRIELDEYNWKRAETSPSGSFRKKFVFTVPGVMKQQKPREYKLKAFVVFLFFLIVLSVSLTYVFHKQRQLQLLQIEIGDRIHFHENTRLIRLVSGSKHDLLSGQLGLHITEDILPYNCYLRETFENRCLEWKHIARLRMSFKLDRETKTRCYSIHWQSLSHNREPQDCFGLENAHWFGVGEIQNQPWPIELNTSHSWAPFVTGNLSSDKYGSILEPYWLSSRGVAIQVDQSVPLFISVNNFKEKQLCLFAKNKVNPYLHSKNDLPFLNYTICTNKDVKVLHKFIAQKFKLKYVVTQTMKSVIENLVWIAKPNNTGLTDEATVFAFIEEIIESGISEPGIIIIDGGWQTEDGDYAFDAKRFQNPETYIKSLRNKGLKVVVTVHPYISTSSTNYMKEVSKGLFVTDALGRVPSLTKWNNLNSAAILDITNNQSTNWFQSKLKDLRNGSHVDGFFFRGGESNFLPYHYTLSNPLPNPDGYTKLYAKLAINSGFAFGISSAIGVQHLPTFVSLSPRNSSWDHVNGIKSVIPAVLSLGLIGYSFVLPGPVGGETNEADFPEEELYLRWLQMSVFLPVLQFSVPPIRYGQDMNRLAKQYFKIRSKDIIPLLKKYALETSETGLPIIRPLWWLAPNDSTALLIDSQFMIGDELMVAPVLERGKEYRDVYFPAGYWREKSGIVHRGKKWYYNYEVKRSDIAFFLWSESPFSY